MFSRNAFTSGVLLFIVHSLWLSCWQLLDFSKQNLGADLASLAGSVVSLLKDVSHVRLLLTVASVLMVASDHADSWRGYCHQLHNVHASRVASVLECWCSCLVLLPHGLTKRAHPPLLKTNGGSWAGRVCVCVCVCAPFQLWLWIELCFAGCC